VPSGNWLRLRQPITGISRPLIRFKCADTQREVRTMFKFNILVYKGTVSNTSTVFSDH
jgi:hypothetical protein